MVSQQVYRTHWPAGSQQPTSGTPHSTRRTSPNESCARLSLVGWMNCRCQAGTRSNFYQQQGQRAQPPVTHSFTLRRCFMCCVLPVTCGCVRGVSACQRRGLRLGHVMDFTQEGRERVLRWPLRLLFGCDRPVPHQDCSQLPNSANRPRTAFPVSCLPSPTHNNLPSNKEIPSALPGVLTCPVLLTASSTFYRATC